MGWVEWLLMIGLIVAGYIVMIVIGGLYPSRPIAMSTLRKELENVIGRTTFSQACIDQLTDIIVTGIAHDILLGKKRGSANSFLEEEAHALASRVYKIVMGDGRWAASEIKARLAQETPDPVWSTLAKHHPERFSLEHLERMQETNSQLRTSYEAISPST
jgi:hypothetical protein